jgi:hypothetical protein
VTKLEA